MKLSNQKLILLIIICIAAVFRFYNLNWDSGFHLHPDERFLTMVGNAMKLPSQSNTSYLDPHSSTMNPVNVGYQFFVYGVFPLTFNKLVATGLNTDNYNDFTIQGRFLSGLFDVLIIFFVYKITALLSQKYKWNKSTPLWASFLYAITVLPIQLSHFFAVDSFLNFFMLGSFYFSLKYYIVQSNESRSVTKESILIILSSLFLGLGIASKINALAILPLNLFFIFWGNISTRGLHRLVEDNSIDPNKESRIRNYAKRIGTMRLRSMLALTFIQVVVYLTVAYLIVRLANPYYFETANIFDPTPSTSFVNNIKSLKSFEGKDIWFPPAVQWMSKQPFTYSLLNLALIGVGFPYFICIVLGVWSLIVYMTKKGVSIVLLAILGWVGLFFLYQSTQFVKALRYFIFLYPFFAIFASVGVLHILETLTSKLPRVSRYAFYIMLVCLLMVWPLAFMSVYVNTNSRVEASTWIYRNLENDALILTEHWDDGLPLPMPDTQGKTYRYEQLPVFDPDTPEKWSKMNDLLGKGDYYILTSNRGWGSIPTVPDKYPQMTQFYEDLFANRTEYKFIKQYSSYPSLRYLGIPVDFPDQWADETFTVYDHPEVNIFKKKNKR